MQRESGAQRYWAAFWCWTILLIAGGGAFAQTPTPEQMKLFQSLPKEQQEALMKQYGLGSGGRDGSRGAAGTAIPTDAITVTQPGKVQPADEDMEVDPRTGMMRERRIKGGEQVLIEIVLPDLEEEPTTTETLANGNTITRTPKRKDKPEKVRSPDEQKRLETLRDLIMDRNPYALSQDGVLQLPGFAPIPLAGLTNREVNQRLAIEPAFREFVVIVTIQRLEPRGVEALKPFGYELFRRSATTFVPGTDIPVPADYRVGPGDVFDVELFGQNSDTLTLPVARDGTISIPKIGPVNVGGMTFGAARGAIESRVQNQMIGTDVRVSLSDLRATRVFVLGDAEKPGSVVVSGLSTVTAALFAAGGVKEIGSLRSIEVKRGGKLVRRLDLYDVLLQGDTANDVRLETGDVVFVPPVGPTVGVSGKVRRPAIYELRGDTPLVQVLDLAGGLDPAADPRIVSIERTGPAGKTMVTVDASSAEGRQFVVRGGDLVRVSPIRPVVGDGIVVEGYVYRPGPFQYRPGLRLSGVLSSVDDLKPKADIHYVLVRREDPATRRISVFSADLAAALASPGSDADIPLAARDRITVFDLESTRQQMVDPLLEDLRRQGRPEAPTSIVTVSGRVNVPGRYPLEPGMGVSDLIRAGGGLEDAAYSSHAELARYQIIDGARRRADLINVDLAAVLRGDPEADQKLQPYDVLTIKQMPEWTRMEEIEVLGEVQFPGRYQIRRGETLRSVLERAGGLTPLAFPEGAVFTREELRQREKEQLDVLASRLQADVTLLSLENSQSNNPAATQALTAGQGLLDQLRGAKPVGRLVIDLERIIDPRGRGDLDVVLRDKDKLIVPRLTQEVSVLGEVQSPTSHLYRLNTTRDDYIALSGGMTNRADRNRPYVVRADGSVVGSTSRWFGAGDVKVHPGDTVVVPLDAGRMRPLPMWTAITTIIYNLAVATAAVGNL
jgi:protein involved in polysaccharide export with SLBB domain